ncbi:metalloregulator ArsR/SmtB family transcription factor [Pseudovibrio sp. Tun.PSC04-5.I4]|uniref:ArsR/SmtB family transcription factor n=1 Tax=Pseudovibrio sp. Tun.PSC04-5.I4 TaxID=1798213 RepID=UPI000881511C|nr:metalloregulator ArsR/SmtB family transcription factor [Pseudovibrio sp. Tun.PSC04-5.I4]SDQ16182.1 DNA-binding transcriptional regulator, ArsR family [Pseudovibrio sp. Tun.PSC04-5.I4]
MIMQTNLPDVFGALADPTRFAIIERLLKEGDLPVGDLAEPFAMSAPAISRHIKLLENAGLIERRVEKQWRVCALKKERFADLHDWIERYRAFWNTSFDRLEVLLDKQQGDNK